MDPRLSFCIQTAFEAGRSTLALYQTGVAVDEKADSSPVTQADRNAEAIVRRLVAQSWPGEAILGEEEGGDKTSLDRWVVDPIDGTKSFVAGVPLFATLLSYEQGGKPIAAAVYFPALDEMFWASKGGGAFWNGRPIQVRQTNEISNATLLSGSYRSMRDHGRMAGYHKLADQAKVTRGWSDAYGHALVASGRADVMLDPVIAHWDISAPSLLVQEAGGVFMDFDGVETLGANAISVVPGLRQMVVEAFR
ncbi:MAG: histidinol phosphate phosphatase [Armatimonadetes bacterium]|nr:histidinol phosphate phosphatase [Armatimonadota bacterium]